MSFANEHPVKATRKDYFCAACTKKLPSGSAAIRWSGMTDGTFSTCVYHTDCRAAEIQMNRECGGTFDEWWPLYDVTEDDRPWLEADFPAVAERLFSPLQPKDLPDDRTG